MDRFVALQAFVRTVERGSQSAAAREIGVEYYITEQDNPNPKNPLGDVETALRNAERRADQ